MDEDELVRVTVDGAELGADYLVDGLHVGDELELELPALPPDTPTRLGRYRVESITEGILSLVPVTPGA